MSSLYALILIPFYFCGALALLPVLVVLARILRLPIGINPLVYTAIGGAVAAIVLPLALDIVDLHSFRGRILVALVLVSMAFGGIDWALKKFLPLPLDEELEHT